MSKYGHVRVMRDLTTDAQLGLYGVLFGQLLSQARGGVVEA